MNGSEFLHMLAQTPLLAVAAVLVVGVLVVNGATDAPNAIASAVAARAIRPRAAVAMAAGCDLLGVLAGTLANAAVAETVAALADFGGHARVALAGLCAGMAAVVLWAAAAWVFGIPTSESHALLAGLSGAAIAVGGGTEALNAAAWGKVLFGLPFSLAAGLFGGGLAAMGVRCVFFGRDRRQSARVMRRLQIAGSAAMAFAHGAQDGQKFIGVLWLAFSLAGAVGAVPIPPWLAVGAAMLMALGTSVGGKRIIKTVGMRMAAPLPYEAFSADAAAAAVLLGASACGLPVSTTHVKTAAMMGAAATNRLRAVNWKVAAEMLWAWVLTFPGCGAAGYLAARLFLRFL
ncbi:MAG: inorganic phosphate transporter [Ruminococcaceae bacterium]|nr:inorganic phosphate transporter [Oscillospiraceae bacterium]